MYRVLCIVILAALVDSNKRILGGFPLNITDAPYQASLQFKGAHECGATIISNRVILTAAHCKEGALRFFFTVRVGSSYRNDGGEVYEVDKIKLHPSYDSITVDYDVALVFLKKELVFSELVQPIYLAEDNPPVGAECLVSGWGKTDDSTYSNILLGGNVKLISRSSCTKVYGDEITDQMLCAGVTDYSIDSCGGDSGGPLVCGDQLTGVVSWGRKCGSSPGVYASVPKVLKWVKSTAGL